LNAVQQERFSRHLLLDPLGGDGQERLLNSVAVVSLPFEAAQAARWAVRSLGASGVGTLVLHGPWASDAAEELRGLAPAVQVLVGAATPKDQCVVFIGLFLNGQDLDVGVPGAPGEHRLWLEAGLATDPASAAAVGAQAAVEAVKLLAGVGTPAALPLAGGM
jgi:hypothetical protein